MAKRLQLEAVFKAVDKMTRPIKKFGQRIRQFSKRAKRAMKSINRAVGKLTRALRTGLKIGFLAAAAGAFVFYRVLTKITSKMDELAKTSRRLEFDIEALQEWGFVAEQSGMESDKFREALTKMVKNVGDAKAGIGTLTTFLKKNDPALLKQLKTTKDSSEAFELIIDKMRRIKDPMLRGALAQGAFGRAGMKLINVAKLSQKEIEALREEMRKNGVVSLETAKKAEAFNDAMNSFKLAIQGALFEAIGPLLPELKDVVRDMREWIVENKDLIKSKVVAFIKGVIERVKAFRDWLVKLQKEHDVLGKIEKGFQFIGKMIEFVVENAESLGRLVAILVSITIAWKALNLVVGIFNALSSLNVWVIVLLAIGAAVLFVYSKFNFLTAALEGMIGEWVIWFLEAKMAIMTSVGDALNWVIEKASAVKEFFGGEPIKFRIDTEGIGKEALAEIEKIKQRQLSIDLEGAIQKDEGKLINRVFSMFNTPEIPGTSMAETPGQRQTITTNDVIRSMEERRLEKTEKAEITIRDETGKASVTKGRLGSGVKMQRTAAFEGAS